MTLTELNALDKPALSDALSKCCGATNWVRAMADIFPVADADALYQQAHDLWYSLTEADWHEAFTHHPKIGDVNALREKFASTAQWAEGEQGAVKHADQTVLEALAEGNDRYEQKFGYIFIVCATGKTADEMLALLQARLPNDPETEIHIAMGEQDKITRIRLEKLLAN